MGKKIIIVGALVAAAAIGFALSRLDEKTLEEIRDRLKDV